jgi:hypothetical protein
MNALRVAAIIMCLLFFTIAYLMSGRFEQQFGHTLFLAGAIIFAAILISSAIAEKSLRR